MGTEARARGQGCGGAGRVVRRAGVSSTAGGAWCKEAGCRSALGVRRHDGRRRLVLEAYTWEMKDNLRLIWIEPKRPNGFSGKPFSPLGSILG
jgi:hypothetical protein